MAYIVVGQVLTTPWLANHRLANQQLCQVGQPVVGQLLVGRPGWDTPPTYMELASTHFIYYIWITPQPLLPGTADREDIPLSNCLSIQRH